MCGRSRDRASARPATGLTRPHIADSGQAAVVTDKVLDDSVDVCQVETFWVLAGAEVRVSASGNEAAAGVAPECADQGSFLYSMAVGRQAGDLRDGGTDWPAVQERPCCWSVGPRCGRHGDRNGLTSLMPTPRLGVAAGGTPWGRASAAGHPGWCWGPLGCSDPPMRWLLSGE